jgi:hypothetical protein
VSARPGNWTQFYLDSVPFKMIHGVLDPARPFKAEITSAGRDRNLGQRMRHHTWAVQVQLGIFEPIGPTSIFCDKLNSNNVAVERI